MLFLSTDFSLMWKWVRNKENHKKNTNIAFIRIEVEKRFKITATPFFLKFNVTQITGGEKRIVLMPYCLSDGPYTVPSALSQAGMIKYLFFQLYGIGNVINIIQILNLPSLFTAFLPPPKMKC